MKAVYTLMRQSSSPDWEERGGGRTDRQERWRDGGEGKRGRGREGGKEEREKERKREKASLFL